jgi:hypothetical protein
MGKSSPKRGRSSVAGKSKTQSRRTVKQPAAHPRVPEPPPLEEAMARVYAKPDFFASLTPERRAAFHDYDGPEIFGSPGPLVRRVKRRARKGT